MNIISLAVLLLTIIINISNMNIKSLCRRPCSRRLDAARPRPGQEGLRGSVHAIRILRFMSFRTQPLANLTPLPIKPTQPLEQILVAEFLVCELGVVVIVRGTKGVPRKWVGASVNLRVRTCTEWRVKHDQTSCCLRPQILGTPLVPSRIIVL